MPTLPELEERADLVTLAALAEGRSRGRHNLSAIAAFAVTGMAQVQASACEASVGGRRNLFFFCTHGKQAADFADVARRIRGRAPDLRPLVFTTRALARPLLASAIAVHRPTVSIEMDWRRDRARVLRGARLLHGGIQGKLEQYKLLEAQGVPIPRWTEITADTSLDPEEWGPYVVVKPSRGGRGAYVWIHKTGRVRFKDPGAYPEGHPGRRGPMIAQQFIYTGRWPIAYRVATYFGRPLSAIRYEGRQYGQPLETEYGFRENGGRSIVAAARGCSISLTAEEDVVDLACRAHAVVPEIPSLGIDIVRDQASGKLYVVEINPGGNTWILTNDSGLEMQAEFGLNFYAQFNALEVIADRSIEIAREYAR